MAIHVPPRDCTQSLGTGSTTLFTALELQEHLFYRQGYCNIAVEKSICFTQELVHASVFVSVCSHQGLPAERARRILAPPGNHRQKR